MAEKKGYKLDRATAIARAEEFFEENPAPWRVGRGYPISGKEEWLPVDRNGLVIAYYSPYVGSKERAEQYAAVGNLAWERLKELRKGG